MLKSPLNPHQLQRLHEITIEGETTKWTIKAKMFPMSDDYRIYSVYGDINKLDELIAYVKLHLSASGVTKGTITITL